MKIYIILSSYFILCAVLNIDQVECGVKRPYNPKMSRLFETKRMSSEFRKRSDAPINLSNVEELLSGIMVDLDTILDDWKEDPPRIRSNSLSSISSGTHEALKNDAEWLREALDNARRLNY